MYKLIKQGSQIQSALFFIVSLYLGNNKSSISEKLNFFCRDHYGPSKNYSFFGLDIYHCSLDIITRFVQGVRTGLTRALTSVPPRLAGQSRFSFALDDAVKRSTPCLLRCISGIRKSYTHFSGFCYCFCSNSIRF